ncbi:MAG TPA: hypothetical protein VGL57_01240 [Solirubrobacteraceae bacterium]|jgi:hypothetical protein
MPRKRIHDQPTIEIDIQVSACEINERDHTRTLTAADEYLSIKLVAARLREDLIAVTESITQQQLPRLALDRIRVVDRDNRERHAPRQYAQKPNRAALIAAGDDLPAYPAFAGGFVDYIAAHPGGAD